MKLWINRIMLFGTAALALVALATILLLVFVDRERTYSLSAVTETVSIVVRAPSGISAYLPRVTVFNGDGNLYERATLKIANGSTVKLARKGDGDIRLTITNDGNKLKEAQLLRILPDGEEQIPLVLPFGTTLRIGLQRSAPWAKNTQIPDSFLIAFQGMVDVGKSVGPLVEDTLLSGRISIYEQAPISGGRFLVREATLDPGDVVEWRRMRSEDSAEVAGFVRAGTEPALQVIAHAAADHVDVSRFGAATYVLCPTVWDRVARDPVISFALSILSGIAILGALFEISVKLFFRICCPVVTIESIE